MYISSLPIQKVTTDDINECLLDLTTDYANSSIDKIYMKLAKIYNKAYRMGVITEDPFSIKGEIEKPRSKKPDKKVEALTLEQEKAFREQLSKKNYRYEMVFWVLLETRHEVWRSFSSET